MLRHPVVRFYLDEDVHKRVAAGLRLRDVIVVSAQVGPGEMTRRLLRLAGAVSVEEIQN
jgi:hypothetical protein